MKDPSPRNRAVLSAVFAKMDVLAMSVACGSLCAVGLFGVTAVLLLQDVAPGQPIGPRLGALGDYLPGYSVSWAGAIAGLPNGFVLGALLGFLIAVLWNLTHFVALASLAIRTAVFGD